MQVALLRVGIDSGSGGIQGPLLADGTFEYIPIPDEFGGKGVNLKTYGNTRGRSGRTFSEYFPERRRETYRNRPIHDDPEFNTFTYGDPTPPKRGLRHLNPGDLLVFYAGLEKWPAGGEPGLYIVGFFEVVLAALAKDLTRDELGKLFSRNFHVRHKDVFRSQKSRLVLVKGGRGSRLLGKATLISSKGTDRNGKPLKVLSPRMQRIFGDFGGHTSIQRSPTRWVAPELVDVAAEFVRSLS